MIELEFLCANPQFPNFNNLLDKHQELYDKLNGMAGIISYRQDFEKTQSLAVILTDNNKRELVLSIAEEIGLSLDTINEVSEDFVNRVIRSELEFIVVQGGEMNE